MTYSFFWKPNFDGDKDIFIFLLLLWNGCFKPKQHCLVCCVLMFQQRTRPNNFWMKVFWALSFNEAKRIRMKNPSLYCFWFRPGKLIFHFQGRKQHTILHVKVDKSQREVIREFHQRYKTQYEMCFSVWFFLFCISLIWRAKMTRKLCPAIFLLYRSLLISSSILISMLCK